MNVLITGAKGFIGSCLSAFLQHTGVGVIAVDNLSRGLNNVEKLGAYNSEIFKFIAYDCIDGISEILDENYLTPYLRSESIGVRGLGNSNLSGIDAVVHLAAGTGSLDRPYEELCKLNIDMTKKVYNDTVKAGIPVFVFPTTSLVEGEGCADAPYVKSKQDAMDWLIAQNDPISVVPLQFYNVTGAYQGFTEHRQKEVHIIPKMMEAAMNGDTFVINGNDYDTSDGTPGRDYTNVVDVCTAIKRLILIQLSNSPFKLKAPIKLGTGRVTTTAQMLSIFNSYTFTKFGKTASFRFGKRRAYDCGWLKCDQPYLRCITDITDIRWSVCDEIDALAKAVYGWS